MIKAIIFDAGGVLLHGKGETICAEIARLLNINFEELEKIRMKNYEDLCTGKLTSEAYAEIIKKQFNLSFSIKEILEKIKQAYLAVMTVNEELLVFAEKLKDNYKVAMITNSHINHADINKKRGFYQHFNPCIVSTDVGLLKPQKEIFELALKKLNLKAEECIFIDDREKHLNTAKSLGFHTILFKNNKQLLKDLEGLGIEKKRKKKKTKKIIL